MSGDDGTGVRDEWPAAVDNDHFDYDANQLSSSDHKVDHPHLHLPLKYVDNPYTHMYMAMTMMTYQSDYGYSTPPSQHGRVLGECGVRREIALGCRKYLAPCLAISYPCHHQLHLLLPKFINRIEGQFLGMQSLEEVEDHCCQESYKDLFVINWYLL